MRSASILIKPASSNCNMDCKYCFYKVLSSNREEYDKGFMSYETLEKLVREGIAYVEDSLTFAFQGGEPTLAGLEFYRKVTELQQKYNTKNLRIENTIQTNGYCIDETWAEFFAEHHFLVGLSLDGPKKLHNACRIDYRGEGTFDRVMHAAALLRQYHVDFNILTVVTEELTQKAEYLYKFYKRNGFNYVQLIPCMDERARHRPCGLPKNAEYTNGAVRAESYGKFLCEMFDLWYEDFMDGGETDIRMFSNLARMAAGYPAEECGMNGCCNCYFVVEGDGSVYPCDFYCMDEWKLGMVGEPFEEMIRSKRAKDFVKNSMVTCSSAMSDSEGSCRNCPSFALCRGGCRRWREEQNGVYGKNKLCAGYQIFFPYIKERIWKLGEMIASKYGRGDTKIKE